MTNNNQKSTLIRGKIIPRSSRVYYILIISFFLTSNIEVNGNIISNELNIKKVKKDKEIGQNNQPNVLFIALDDLNNWVGCLDGHPDVKTPNIDRLAKRGMLFTNAHCSAPICNPSRTSLLSGVRPSSTGNYYNADHWSRSEVIKKATPLTSYFSQNGYHTMGGGKIYHGPGIPQKETKLWDEWATRFTGFAPGAGENVRRADSVFADGQGPHHMFLAWGPLNDKESERLADTKAAEWAAQRLNQDFDKPFFLGVGFHRPHVPLTAPQRFFDMYNAENIQLPPLKMDDLDDLSQAARQAAIGHFYATEEGCHNAVVQKDVWKELVHSYLASISYADECVGTVLDALENSKYNDNTIVVLWSDNGWSLGERFHWEKWGLWDDGTQVPLIISIPEKINNASRCDAPVSLIDLYPTLVDLCGLPPNNALEGQSLRPLLLNPEKDWERPALTTLGKNNHSLHSKDWHYIKWSDGTEELYKRTTDVNEWYNLADKPKYTKVKSSFQKWLPTINENAIYTDQVGNVFHPKQGEKLNFLSVQPGIVGEAISVEATINSENENGVILCHGNTLCGYALYLNKGKLEFAIMDVPAPLNWNTLKAKKTIISSPNILTNSEVKVKAKLSKKGKMSLFVNGKKVAEGDAGNALSIHPNGVMLVGKASVRYPKYVPIGNYNLNDEFEGNIKDVTVQFGNGN